MRQNTIITEVEDYCRKAGISPSTLTVRVLGNSRFLERMRRRLNKAEEDAQKLRSFMQQNPPDGLGEAG